MVKNVKSAQIKTLNACLGLLMLIALQNCKVAEPIALPDQVEIPDSFEVGYADSSTMAALSYETFFSDPRLVTIIDRAMSHNPMLLATQRGIDLAYGDVLLAESRLLPMANGVVSAGFDRFGEYTIDGVGNYDTNLSDAVTGNRIIPDPVPDYFLGFRSSWEIDLWGKLRDGKESAKLRFLASEEAVHLLKTELVSQVAGNYYELLALDAELDIINKNIELQETALELVEIQKAAGRVTELAISQVQAQLFNTQALKTQLQQQYIATENYLNALLGKMPDSLALGISIKEQRLPEQVDTGIPSLMLLRRPDIRQAELQLEAAKADVEAARKAFLPSFNLTPYVGLNAFRTSVLFDPKSMAVGALGGLTNPLFNRKHLKGNLRKAEAKKFQAFYRYQQSILLGMEEVYTGLKQFENLEKAVAFKREEVAALNKAVNNSQQLFVAGYATYLEVVTAQESVLEAELDLVTLQKQQFISLVNLYRALGGGWQ